MTRPMISLEFNELSPTLMDQFIGEGKLPNFARLKEQSQVFVTEAEEIAPNLEPWIQWITIHTGLSYKEHGVFDLGDGHKVPYPRIWDLLSEQGRKVWICGSMNAAFEKPPKGYFLPDPWSVGAHPYPEGEFGTFFNYVCTNVQEHTRDSMAVSKMDHLRFLAFMLGHGLSLASIRAILAQLNRERSGKYRWQRAVLLDRLQWDVFAHYWNREHPDFSTFFVNSTAHFQHCYWRNMNPDPFTLKPKPGEQEEYKDAIQFGYQSMDKLVGECLDMAGPDTVVVLSTALSQQPCVIYEHFDGKVVYRVNDPGEFFTYAGIKGAYRYAPVMAEQFHLYFQSAADAAEAVRLMKAMTCDGKPLMFVTLKENEVFGGCGIYQQASPNAAVKNSAGEAKPFSKLFYLASGVKSGMHHPDGIFWIRDRAQKASAAAQRISLRQVAPTMLGHFGIGRRDYMSMGALPAYDVEETSARPVARV